MSVDLRPPPSGLTGYLRHNYRRIALDLLVLLAWAVVATRALGTLGVFNWLQYVVVFVGVVAYVELTPRWERPSEGD